MNKQIINYFRQNIPVSLLFLFSLMMLGALFEVVGIGLFIPLLSGENESGFIDGIKSFFVMVSLEYTHLNIAILIIGIFLVKFIVMNIQNFYIYKASNEFLYQVKKSLMSSLYRMNFIEYNKIGTDTLNNIFTKEIEKSALSIQYLLQIGVSGIYSLAYLFFALYINYMIVAIAVVVGSIVVMLQRKITKGIVGYSKIVVNGNTQTNLIVLQILGSMKYIKSTNRYKYNDQVFDKVSRDYSDNVEKMSFLNSIPKHTPEFVGILVISLIIIINELTLKENIVSIVFLGLLLYRTLIKMLSVQKSYQDFLINIGAIEKIIDIKNHILNHKENEENKTQNKVQKIDIIEVKDVSIEIDNKAILSNISLNLQKGSSYAIVGQSGAGKSTLLNALTLLYTPTDGQVTINETENIDRITFREKVGYVSQETVIFEGSIKENILFGETFEDTKYDNVVSSLGIDKINVDKLTMSGTNISGGQRQLIALARELYKEPDLLILDEFTSALDSATEKKVMRFIDCIKENKIVIIVAHRLSSIIDSDMVFLMKNGKIIDRNNFENMYSENSEFKSMCNNQNIFLERK